MTRKTSRRIRRNSRMLPQPQGGASSSRRYNYRVTPGSGGRSTSVMGWSLADAKNFAAHAVRAGQMEAHIERARRLPGGRQGEWSHLMTAHKRLAENAKKKKRCNFATMAELKTRLAKAQARLADGAQLASTVEGYETSFKGGTRSNENERRVYVAARREIARRAPGARQAEHPSLRRNSRMLPYGTTYRSPEDKARLAVEYLSSRDPSDPARQRAELKLARMFRTKSPRTAESVRRKIAAAEATRERTREAYEKAIFAGAPREERLRLMQAFDAADSERFQAQMKLAEMGLRRNSLRPPTWENYNEDTGVVLDRFSSRLDAIREAEDWRRSGHRVSSRKIGLRSNSRRRTSLRRNSADWSTRTAVAAKARAAFARGDSRSANRYLSELSAIDLAMMPRAVRRNGRRRTSRRRTSRR